jgi:hypothetical protein
MLAIVSRRVTPARSEQRLPPGDLGAAKPDRVAEKAQDEVPAKCAQGKEERQDDDRRDQPGEVEVNAFALDLRPLVDDREDEKAEDQDNQADLKGEANPAAARRARPEPRSRLAYPM